MELTAEVTELVTCGSIVFHSISVLSQAMTEKEMKVATEYQATMMILSLGLLVESLVKAVCV